MARTRFAAARASNGSLWLGTDHLLSIDSTGYTENYKRFYFRDIQAITIEKTRTWQIWNFIWGTSIFISVALAVATKPAGPPSGWSADGMVGLFVCGGISLLLLIFFLINLLLGATCKCYLRTAVQIEELSSLRRIRKTSQILEKIRPLIAAAQGGELTPQNVAEKMREQIPPPAAAAQTATQNPDLPPKLDT
jgi:hypothetical protein